MSCTFIFFYFGVVIAVEGVAGASSSLAAEVEGMATDKVTGYGIFTYDNCKVGNEIILLCIKMKNYKLFM